MLLVIVNIFTVPLCVFANQAAGQAKDIFPARILSNQKTISENSDFYAICSLFGSKKVTGNKSYIYLCKDGRGMDKKRQKADENDTAFIVTLGLHDSGNYSCVYSKNNYPLSEVAVRGVNIIPIRVIASSYPADIAVAGSSAVSEGDNVKFKCSVSVTLQTLCGCQIVHSYLMRDGSVFQARPFNVTRMEVNFTIEGAIARHSGYYSCVVLPSKCIQAPEMSRHGNNTVLIKVKGNATIKLFALCGAMMLTSAILGLCFIKNRAGNLAAMSRCSQRAMRDGQEEQQEQQEAENVDAQDDFQISDDYSSMEEEEDCETIVAVEEDNSRVYATIDEIRCHGKGEKFETLVAQDTMQMGHLQIQVNNF